MNTYVQSHLQSIDESKREEWNKFYANSYHPEDAMKNDLINRTHRFCPGFKYLIDFEWKTAYEGKGDLILGSENGVYLIIETKSLHTGSGRTAQVSRHNARHRVREQASRYRELATARFGVGATVIGAIFTNDDYKIHFLDDYDERVARRVARGKKDLNNIICDINVFYQTLFSLLESQMTFLDFMDRVSVLIICVALSLSIYSYKDDDVLIVFPVFYLLSVCFSVIILGCFGKSQRYYIYYFAIPIIIILFLVFFGCVFWIISHVLSNPEAPKPFDNLYINYVMLVMLALCPFFLVNYMIEML